MVNCNWGISFISESGGDMAFSLLSIALPPVL